MAKKVLVIRNPSSASGKKQNKVDKSIELLQSEECQLQVYETKAAEDATHYLLQLQEKFDVVVAAGGDGTVNEVINGLVNMQNVVLAVIPSGTTNVLAKELNLPNTPKALVDIILNGVEKSVYLGRLNGRRFSMMVGIGYDAWTVNYVNLEIKKRFGKLAYIISMFKQFWHYGKQQYLVNIDGKEVTASSMIITQGKYYAGSFLLSRQADLSRQTMQAITMATHNRAQFFLSCLALPFGLLEKAPYVQSVAAKDIKVSCVNQVDKLNVLQMDGDNAGALPAHLVIEEQAISILVAK